MALRTMLDFRAVIFLIMALSLILLSACGSSDTPTATQPAAETPAPDATSAPQPTAAPAPTSAHSSGQAAQPAPTATQAPRAEPTATTAAPAMAVPTGTLVAALTEVYPFQSAPVRASGGLELFLSVTVTEPPVGMDTNNEFRPKLIENWNISPDGLIWTFDVSKGVQLHKGYGEMTAEDMLWSISELASEESSNAFRNHLRRLWLNEDNGGSTTIVNDHKL